MVRNQKTGAQMTRNTDFCNATNNENIKCGNFLTTIGNEIKIQNVM